jgi:hypothetical protein
MLHIEGTLLHPNYENVTLKIITFVIKSADG